MLKTEFSFVYLDHFSILSIIEFGRLERLRLRKLFNLIGVDQFVIIAVSTIEQELLVLNSQAARYFFLLIITGR